MDYQFTDAPVSFQRRVAQQRLLHARRKELHAAQLEQQQQGRRRPRRLRRRKCGGCVANSVIEWTAPDIPCRTKANFRQLPTGPVCGLTCVLNRTRPSSTALDPLFRGTTSDFGASDSDNEEPSSEAQAPIIVVSNRLPFVLKRTPDGEGLLRKAR